MVSRILLPEFNAVDDSSNEPLKEVYVENLLVCHNSKPVLNDISMVECPICMDSLALNNCVTNTCGHSICDTCAMKYLETQFTKNHNVCCSVCRHPFHLLESSNEIVANTLFQFVGKCQTLMEGDSLPIFEYINRRARTVDFNDYDNILED
jgi:hypothetical protein